MSVKLEDLKPEVMFKAQHAITSMIDKGIPFSIRRTLSTQAEQYAYWLQGRATLGEVNVARIEAHMRLLEEKENSYTVTRCDGKKIKSNHQSGRAIDIVPKDENGNPTWNYAKYAREFQIISDIMKGSGFSWGGDWTSFLDPPHYQV